MMPMAPTKKSGTRFDLGHLYAVPQVFDDGLRLGMMMLMVVMVMMMVWVLVLVLVLVVAAVSSGDGGDGGNVDVMFM